MSTTSGWLIAIAAAASVPAQPAYPPVAALGATQDTVVTAEDAYHDEEARRLIGRARKARGRADTTLHSFEVTWRERAYIGLDAQRQRRERLLLRQERAARVHWRQGNQRTVRWLGIRQQAAFGRMEEDPDLTFSFLDPSSDRLFLGDAWAIHPLADTAGAHYRYRSGDTLRISVAGLDRTVSVLEVLVEPREARFDQVAASLWFDEETAQLVRAVYRPARDFNLERDQPEDAGEVPRFLKPIRFATDWAVVEYGLQELEWWLPNRIAFKGRGRIADAAAFPLEVEWSFDGYALNVPETLDPGEEVPSGWRRIVLRGDSAQDQWRQRRRARREERNDRAGQAGELDAVVVGPDTAVAADSASNAGSAVIILPPREILESSDELPEPIGTGAPLLSPAEIRAARDRLASIALPPDIPGRPRLIGPLSLTRYNRVEALGLGLGLSVPTGAHTALRVTGRFGVADLEPKGELRFGRVTERSEIGIAVYRRLAPTGDWGNPLGLANSLNALLFGADDGQYFRATGFELAAGRAFGTFRLDGRLFAERQRGVEKNTDFSLANLIGGSDFQPVIPADSADIFGISARLRAWNSAESAGPRISGTVWGELGGGDFDYGRVAGSAAAVLPLGTRFATAVEAGAGISGGGLPIQRLYYLGGPYTVRGYETGALRGEHFWLGRLEIAALLGRVDRYGPARAVRLVGFFDAGWAGDGFSTEGHALAVGGGVSLLDGLLRIDLAKGLDAIGLWRLYVYGDGLF
ncbi:MAG: BamA/TamA family outer membrane protein [Gemmatimonadota bacterium]|nr:MAG: BamA/TamA family outer membrane protein [Gemmatimonadota bacterium]